MNNLEEGIQFEGTDIFIPWGIQNEELANYGNPEIIEEGGRIHFYWRDKSLLGGIVADWSAYYYSFEKSKFDCIGLSFVGDKISQEKFHFFSQYLTNMFGLPEMSEVHGNKELKWIFNGAFVTLYFFEMHCYRCNLTIGRK